jgi:hypothetical protein
MLIKLRSEKTKILDGNARSALANALRLAGRQYQEDAAKFRAIEKQGGIKDFMTPEAAAHLAQQFERQQQQAHDLADDIEESIQVLLDNDEDGNT